MIANQTRHSNDEYPSISDARLSVIPALVPAMTKGEKDI